MWVSWLLTGCDLFFYYRTSHTFWHKHDIPIFLYFKTTNLPHLTVDFLKIFFKVPLTVIHIHSSDWLHHTFQLSCHLRDCISPLFLFSSNIFSIWLNSQFFSLKARKPCEWNDPGKNGQLQMHKWCTMSQLVRSL